MYFKNIIDKITPKKFGFWRRYIITFLSIIILTIVFAIIHGFVGNKTTNIIFSIFTLLLTFLIIITPIAIIAYIIITLNNKYEKKKREEEKKKQEELQLTIRELIKKGRDGEQDIDIYLPKGEFCLNVFGVITYKTKTQTKSINYSGMRYKVRIAKGLNYTIGNMKPSRETIKTQYIDDKGILYLTNKRIIVKLEKNVENIPYEKLLYVDMIPGGVVLYKQTGKPIEYKFIGKNYNEFPIYLSEILNTQKELEKPDKKKKNEKDVV